MAGRCNCDTIAEDSVIEDPFCNERVAKKIDFESIAAAAILIRTGVVRTPCKLSRMSDTTGMNLYLKNEFMQYTGSFKERGARYVLLKLSEEQKQKGVVSASAGNHAQAISYHGLQLGIPVTVVMPVVAPIMKIQKCKKFKADVIVDGKNMTDAKNIAMKLAKERGVLYINGYDHPDILAGQGTVGLEILQQVPDVDAIVVPTGGGGLLAGIAAAVKNIKPEVKVMGVESIACPGFANALIAGKPIDTTCHPTLADGLAVPFVGYNSVETAKAYVDRMIAVQEEDISVAILRLLENEKYVVEGAAASSLAAVLSGQLKAFKKKNVVLVLSGGNIDTTVLGRVMDRGLAADGRLLKVYVTVSDRPGGLCELCQLVSSCGVSIKSIGQERAYINFDIYSVQVKLVCETRDYEHALEMESLLQSRYGDVHMVHAPFPDSSSAEPVIRKM